ncbi:MAG: SDR family oxidoreductase [Bacteroidota bacterium]
MEIDLKGKRSLVCGSSQGIGFAIAQSLAECGSEVVLMARNEERLKSAKNELNSDQGQSQEILVADFSDSNQVEKVINDYLSENEGFDVLINNTGGPAGGELIDSNIQQLRKAFEQHILCSQILTQYCVKSMKSNGYGRIINIVSTSVKIPIPGLGVSNTIRGAMANWSKTLSLELAEYGITINNILPGFVKTARLDSIINSKSEKSAQPKEQVQQNMINSVPAKRFGEPIELGYLAAFLASPFAAYINGVNIPVDGGRTGSL